MRSATPTLRLRLARRGMSRVICERREKSALVPAMLLVMAIQAMAKAAARAITPWPWPTVWPPHANRHYRFRPKSRHSFPILHPFLVPGKWAQICASRGEPQLFDGFDIKLATRYCWEWNWEQVHAEEAAMAAEREHEHDEAMRADREDAEHLRHLLGGHLFEPGHTHFARGVKRGAESLSAVGPR